MLVQSRIYGNAIETTIEGWLDQFAKKSRVLSLPQDLG